MAKKVNKAEKWESVPAKAFKSEEDIKKELDEKNGKVRGKYEEKVAVDISFEDLIKLSVSEGDKKEKT